MKYYDITLPFSENLCVWPGDTPIQIAETRRIAAGETCNVSRLTFSGHSGTHMDAPLHFIAGGSSIDQIPLERMIGACEVWDLGEIDAVDVAQLNGRVVPDGGRVLLKCARNGRIDYAAPFARDFVALTPDAAQWFLDNGIVTLGIDALSVERFGTGFAVHHTLLGAGITIIEGLNLRDITPGAYQLIALPMNIVGGNGAPVRAVLVEL